MSVLIKSVKAREILDSRANPTVECEVILTDGAVGVASVPSGASRGSYEAVELRDNDERRYLGKGTLNAVDNVNKKIAPLLFGASPFMQQSLDYTMITQDGTNNKSNLGANAILSVSEALAAAAANSLRVPLYEYLSEKARPTKMPQPMLNVLNGGAHAKNNLDIQEFMLIPNMKDGFGEAIRRSVEVYHSLKSLLDEKGLSSAIGDEGGFAPNLDSDKAALGLLSMAVERAGYILGEDFSFALDMAGSEWYSDGIYRLPKSGRVYTSFELCEYVIELCKEYPIVSVEDGMGENDTEGFKALTEKLAPLNISIVGDDLFVTDPIRVKRGIEQGIANAVLIKPNQIGTVTETVKTVRLAKDGGYTSIMSHRSGETESTFIADLAVALGTERVKLGAPARSERTAKYNRLMKIEQELFSAPRH